MAKRVGWFYLVVAAALLSAGPAEGRDLTVGPAGGFARIEEAAAKATAGDTIVVYPRKDGRAYEQTAVFVTAARITFRAAAGRPGGRVAISGKGFDYSGRGRIPRAIFQFNKGADGCVLEGFELSGAHNDSHNGAGVRINQANNVTIRHCHIHGNDMGVMSNGDGTDKTAANQWIEGCLMESNGSAAEPGYNHNLYLGGTSATLVGCEVRRSLTGHNIKSRAHQTTVVACYVHDSANRELDLVDAAGDTTARDSNAYVAGNVIVKDARCKGNRNVIHFGSDGGHEHDGTVYLVNNTIVTPFLSPVVFLSAGKAKGRLVNNIVWDGGAQQSGQKLAEVKAGFGAKAAVGGQCNWLSSGFAADAAAWGLARTFLARAGQAPPFADAARGDFRLARVDEHIVGQGAPWREAFVVPGPLKGRQYRPPQSKEDRTDASKPDLGAYQYVGKADR